MQACVHFYYYYHSTLWMYQKVFMMRVLLYLFIYFLCCVCLSACLPACLVLCHFILILLLFLQSHVSLYVVSDDNDLGILFSIEIGQSNRKQQRLTRNVHTHTHTHRYTDTGNRNLKSIKYTADAYRKRDRVKTVCKRQYWKYIHGLALHSTHTTKY